MEIKHDPRAAADQLNRDCFCVTLDMAALETALRAQINDDALAEIMTARPHLFAHSPVFLPESDRLVMREIVAAIEAAAQNPQFVRRVLKHAPAIASHDFGPRGVFMSYDFHMGENGPKLIEINTNAGGAFLNALLARAQLACCLEVEPAIAQRSITDFDARVVRMFEAEWRAQERAGEMRRILIVDDAPERQFLYPEFLLARRMLERAGYEVDIVDPQALRYDGEKLLWEGRPVDLIYNRLVDFSLDAPEHAALRRAYIEGAIVLTPNPHNHALFADKRNLIILSDPDALNQIGLADQYRQALKGIPEAHAVAAANAEQFWNERKRFFFKPASGYGGKAVYRGDKLTHGVWADIVGGDYIAQALARPSERMVDLNGVRTPRKLDVRLYTYAGDVLLTAARLYQGQTTNFRTEGGGFAPVFFF